MPIDVEKVANEGPQVAEEVQNKESILNDDSCIFTSSIISDSTSIPQNSTARPNHSTAGSEDSTAIPKVPTSSPKFPSIDKQGRSFADLNYPDDPNMPPLEHIYYDTDDEALDGTIFGAEADVNNMELNIPVSPTPTTKVHKNHLKAQILGDPSSTIQTRRMTKEQKDQVHQGFFARQRSSKLLV